MNNDLQSEGVRWVQRMVKGQGIVISDREAHWWAVYLRQFFRYAREHGARGEAGPLIRAYLEALERRLPAEQRWQAEKAGRVLDIFLASIENWRWVEEEGQWSPKFRLKAAPPSEGPPKSGT
jgi:hypothetical protein